MFRDEGIVRDDAHAEGGRPARDFLADTAEAGEAERLLANFLSQKLFLFPLSLLHCRVRGREVASHRQDQADGELGNRDTVGARRIHDDNAARAGCGYVNVVNARARARDDAQFRGCGDQWCSDFRGASDDEGIGILEVGGKLVGCPSAAGVHVPAFGAQQIQRRRWRSSATTISLVMSSVSVGGYKRKYNLAAVGWRGLPCNARTTIGANS